MLKKRDIINEWPQRLSFAGGQNEFEVMSIGGSLLLRADDCNCLHDVKALRSHNPKQTRTQFVTMDATGRPMGFRRSSRAWHLLPPVSIKC